MPNRILKESICTSDNIDVLSAFQETFFYRLIVNCDDYGRMDARPKILASRLFPLKDIRAAQIEDALRALTSAELVTLYMVGGKPFLQMNTWNQHQRVRDSKEKYPGMEKADEIVTEIPCGELQQVAASCGESRPESNPIQSESKSNPNPYTAASAGRAGKKNKSIPEGFDEFWSAYPKHQDKQGAIRAFTKISPDADLLARLLSAIAAWKNSQQWMKDNGQYIPMPATWLNGRRWEDEIPKAGRIGKTVTAQAYTQRSYTEDELLAIGDDLMAEARMARDQA